MASAAAAAPFLQFSYSGNHPDQFCRVHLPPPDCVEPVFPTAVIVHGGFWKNKWTIDNAAHTSLAPALASSARPYVAVEVEYRRRDHDGGGYPGSIQDVVDFLGFLPTLVNEQQLPVDLTRLVLIGHSAGGQIALRAGEIAARSPEPIACPALIAAVAPVTDLERAFHEHLSDEGDAAELFMKCRPEDERSVAQYQDASPLHHLPNLVPLILAVGTQDTDVPMKMVQDFAAAVDAAGGAPSELLLFDGADHYTPMDASTEEWKALRERIDSRLLGPSASGSQ